MSIEYPGTNPLGPPPWQQTPQPVPNWFPPTTTNTTQIHVPEKRALTGAKIFKSIKKANKFMDEAVIEDVEISQTDEGLLIVVYYLVGEEG